MDIRPPLPQPDSWNLMRLACCRCGAQRGINREKLATYDAESKVFLCADCEVEDAYCGRCDDDAVELCEHELCHKCCGCHGEPA